MTLDVTAQSGYQQPFNQRQDEIPEMEQAPVEVYGQ